MPKLHASVTLTKKVGRRTRELTVPERKARHLRKAGWTDKPSSKPTPSTQTEQEE